MSALRIFFRKSGQRGQRSGRSDTEPQLLDHPQILLGGTPGDGQVVSDRHAGGPCGEDEPLHIPKVHLATAADNELPQRRREVT